MDNNPNNCLYYGDSSDNEDKPFSMNKIKNNIDLLSKNRLVTSYVFEEIGNSLMYDKLINDKYKNMKNLITKDIQTTNINWGKNDFNLFVQNDDSFLQDFYKINESFIYKFKIQKVYLGDVLMVLELIEDKFEDLNFYKLAREYEQIYPAFSLLNVLKSFFKKQLSNAEVDKIIKNNNIKSEHLSVSRGRFF
jgi:hypothetical protein